MGLFYCLSTPSDHIIRGKLKCPRYNTPPVETFSQEEIRTLLKAAEYTEAYKANGGKRTRNRRPTGDRDRAIILVLLDTGIRWKGGPGGARTSTREQQQEYIDALYAVIPLERFKRMVDKVATHVEQTGSIKAFEAIADRMFGKPIQMEPNTSSQGMENLLAMLAEVRKQREEWQAANSAESSAMTVIGVTSKVTQ